ncbi:MAG: DUF2161 family putative PD-(D/E)XK-type phosphodiesterase [Acholeplasmataceae bacterium]|nr:DUF2161 family putative PD-(D/E)XK-type phosphodiesterase [Acholeplasmataceae bacterium]
MKETELFEPIKKLLAEKGYHIKGEVGHVDVYGVKENQTIAVELKTTISLKLIYQAIDRLKVADFVYIGIPEVAVKGHKSDMKYLKMLLTKLNMGIIVVNHDDAYVLLEIPKTDLKKKDNIKKRKIIKEFNERTNHLNVGGTKGKKVTAYKEKVIKIAYALRKMKQASPKILMQYTGINETSSILRNDFEAWFEKVERGIYKLSPKGEIELNRFLDVLDIQ